MRFSRIYGNAWDKDFDNNSDGLAEEWLDTLCDITRKELEGAIRKCREVNPTWPPKPGEFLKLCQGIEAPVQFRIPLAQAAEIANKRVQRLYPFTSKEAYFRIAEIYEALTQTIFRQQNENCDFAVCSVDGCQKFHVFDNGLFFAWQCDEHNIL